MYTTSFQVINREEVRQQLAALGYKAGDTVYLRAFYPDSDPRKTKDAGRKAEATKLDHLIKHATTFQAEGRGIYLVVNGGGHKDKDVTQARAIFYEHDSLDKSLQLDLWKDLGLPEPTLQVDTGGKSIHSYWVFDESVVVEDWRPLQTDLLEFADADRSLKNPSRVMRLAGAWHSSGNQSVIVSNSGKRYTYDDLRAIVPTPEKTEPLLFQPKLHPPSTVGRCEDITVPVPASVPLEDCLAKSSRNLLNGISEGGRNEAGAKLARDLIGTANYLRTIGQQFDGDPRQFLEDFAARCSPPLPGRETEAVWKSAEKDNPTPACKAEGVENRIRGWYWKNHAGKMGGRAIGEKKVLQVSSPKSGSIGEANSNVIPLFPPNSSLLREALTALINAGTAGSELTEAIFDLAIANGGTPQTIWRIYHAILEETECADQRLDRKKEVENLLTIGSRRLTLENYLHPSLAEPIKKVATWMGVDPEAVLTHLLPIAAGLINPNSRVVAKECTNFVEPFLIYSGVVALSGARKTPVLNIPKNPLVRLQSVEDARYQQAIQMYDAEVQKLKATQGQGQRKDSSGELPQKPNPPREFYLDNATVEAVDKVKGQQPDHGVTLIKDELSGLFASHGAYKGGKGADKESYLSGWNGGGVKKNRAGDGSRVSLARDSLSITGGIQPDKLRELLGDFSDSQGEWARFLWYHMPMRPYKIPRDDTRYDLGDLLEGIYKKIEGLPVLKLRFDKQGQTYWDDWHDKKDEQKRAETRPGLQAAIAKMPGQSVRLIGLLHVLWEVASGSNEIREEIPLAIVKSGIQLAEFYLGQVTLLQVDGDIDTGELSPIFKKLLDKVAEFETLTARQASQSIRDLKQTKAPKVRELFTELKAMGLAETQGTGTRMILVQKVLADSKDSQKDQNPYSVDILGNNTLEVLASVDKVLASNSQPQPHTESGFQDVKHQSVDTVDAIETFDLSPPSPELVEPISLGEDKQVSEISNEGVNTPTLSTQRYIEQAIEGVGKTSTVDVNTFEIANTSPIASPEPETAPTAQTPPDSQPPSQLASGLADEMRKAIAKCSRKDAGEVMNRVIASDPQVRGFFAKAFSKEENISIRLLKHCGLVRGTQVKYVGNVEQYREEILTVDDINAHNELACLRPDGKGYTTWLKSDDLRKL